MSLPCKFDGRVARAIPFIAALAVIAATAVGHAQTMQPQYAPPPPPPNAQYMSPPPYAPAADVEVGRWEPCGGDFGMLEQLEAERHDLPQVNPTGAPMCD